MTTTVRRTAAALALAAMVMGALVTAGSAPVSAAAPAPGSMSLTGPATSVWSQHVSISAKVTRLPRQPYPTGTVTFYLFHIESSTPSAIDVPLGSTGTAVLRYRDLLPGSTDVIAAYGGGGPYSSTSSPPIGITTAKASTTTTIATKRTPVPSAGRASFEARTAKIAPATGSLAGTTTFTATSPGQTTITADLPTNTSGRAVWAPILPDARWTVTATYGSSTGWNGSTSTGVVQIVGTPPPAVDQSVDAEINASVKIVNRADTSIAWAQTFTPGYGGLLTAVGANLVSDGGGVVVQGRIETVNPDTEHPTGDVLATFEMTSEDYSFQGFVDATLSNPVPVSVGTQYAIVLGSLTYQAPDHEVSWRYAGLDGNAYTGGKVYQRTPSSWYTETFLDLRFRTFVAAR